MELFNKENAEKITASIKSKIGGDSKTGVFFASLKNRMGIGSPEKNSTDTYERGMDIVPQCISATQNEIPIKQYNVAVLRNLLKFERAEGRVQVTNKRVIFRAAGRSIGGRTTLQHEFAIEEIAGIEAKSNFKFSFLYLLFALIIIAFASLILYGPSNLSGIMSLLTFQSDRISSMMYPKHLQNAYINQDVAIALTRKAEQNAEIFVEKAMQAREAEEKATVDTRDGILRTRRVVTGEDWWGNRQYRNESYRDKSPEGLQAAQEKLKAATEEREKAEADEQNALAELNTARDNEAKAIKKTIVTENIWKLLMTLLGLILGFGGAIPFFVLYKKFGLKLFILNFSIFGFMLALIASGFKIFLLFNFLAALTLIICIFFYCFRPNLLIGIKNKGGRSTAVNIRRDTLFTKQNESGTGFPEVIPTEETESAIREIGAIINDIQKLGDSAVEKWAKK